MLKFPLIIKRFYLKRQHAFYHELARTSLSDLIDREPRNFVGAGSEIIRWIVDGALGRHPVSWYDRRRFAMTLTFEVSPLTNHEIAYWDFKTKREEELFPVDELDSWLERNEIPVDEERWNWINLLVDDDWSDDEIRDFLAETNEIWDDDDLVELGASDDLMAELEVAKEEFEENKSAWEDRECYYHPDTDECYDEDGEWFDIDEEYDPDEYLTEHIESTWLQRHSTFC
jgi:hypothetical protein